MQNIPLGRLVHLPYNICLEICLHLYICLFTGSTKILPDPDYKPSEEPKEIRAPDLFQRNVALLCKTCGKSFSRSGNLKIHIHTVHEGRKDYKCVFCNKSFTGAQCLKKHMHSIHQDKKDFKCETCGGYSKDISRCTGCKNFLGKVALCKCCGCFSRDISRCIGCKTFFPEGMYRLFFVMTLQHYDTDTVTVREI